MLPLALLSSPSDFLPVHCMPLPPPLPSLVGLFSRCFSSVVKWTSPVFSPPGRLPFEALEPCSKSVRLASGLVCNMGRCCAAVLPQLFWPEVWKMVYSSYATYNANMIEVFGELEKCRDPFICGRPQ